MTANALTLSTIATAMTAAEPDAVMLIPLNKLKKSPRNARKTPHTQAHVEALAASIATKGMLQNLVVQPETGKDDEPTGNYFVTIGEGRRLAHLLLAKRKEIKKSAVIRCVLDTVNDAHEISLDENVTREAMHPADQFEAFRVLAEERGLGAEEIAARFGVTAHVVKQRLRLGNISPRLMQLYRDGVLTLDQLKAFALTDDHIRQEQVYDNLSYNRDPSQIRRELTRSHVAPSDRRAVFVGAEAYEEAGGVILRDLFSETGHGYFQDVALLDRLALEKLEAVASELREREGWKWTSAHIDFPSGHGLRRTYPAYVDLSEEDEAAYTAAKQEYDTLNEQYDSAEELPDEIDARLGELETLLESLDAKRYTYAADDIARGGAFVVLSYEGTARIERGFIRPEDEAPEPEEEIPAEEEAGTTGNEDGPDTEQPETASEPTEQEDEGDALKPISDTLTRELSAHRTQALRLALSEQPDKALLALTHALAAQVFYRSADAACLDIRATSAYLGSHATGIESTPAATALSDRHEAWSARLPQRVADLWHFVTALDPQELVNLLAHCVAFSATALRQPWEHRPVAQQTAEQLISAVNLDMTAFWSPTVESYFGNVTKAHILRAVREAVNEEAAERIAHLKKPEMAQLAAELVAGTGWLPEPLRTATPHTPEPDDAIGSGPMMLDAAE